jgi:ParB/RepB/Spo0J family partition protein
MTLEGIKGQTMKNLKRSKTCEVYDVPLAELVSHQYNKRDSSPLIGMGYGIFARSGKRPSLMGLALSKNSSERQAYIDLIDRFDPVIAATGKDILDKGILQPIGVCETKGGYDVIFGCRRILATAYAACLASIANPAIPARIMELDESEKSFVSFSENLHRLGQTAMEEAKYYEYLTQELSMSIPDIAHRFSINDQHVRQRLKLNELPQSIQDKVAAGKIAITKAVKMAGMTEAELAKQDLEKKQNRRRMPTLKELQDWYQLDDSLTEDVRKFIASRILKVRYQPRKAEKV